MVPLPYGGFIPFIVHAVFLSAFTIPVALASWMWLERPMLDLAARLSERWRQAHASVLL